MLYYIQINIYIHTFIYMYICIVLYIYILVYISFLFSYYKYYILFLIYIYIYIYIGRYMYVFRHFVFFIRGPCIIRVIWKTQEAMLKGQSQPMRWMRVVLCVVLTQLDFWKCMLVFWLRVALQCASLIVFMRFSVIFLYIGKYLKISVFKLFKNSNMLKNYKYYIYIYIYIYMCFWKDI